MIRTIIHRLPVMYRFLMHGAGGLRSLAVVAVGLIGAACKFEPGALRSADDARTDTPVIDGPSTDGFIPDGSTPNPDAAVDGPLSLQCPTTYTLVDSARPDSRYHLVTTEASWTAAEANCESHGGGAFLPTHLIVLDDATERLWAYNQGSSDKWVGASDRITEGTFRAVTDQPNPYFGNPGSNATDKDCVFTKQSATEMEVCTKDFPYLCECDGRAANPANF
jgi:hypothetical protein